MSNEERIQELTELLAKTLSGEVASPLQVSLALGNIAFLLAIQPPVESIKERDDKICYILTQIISSAKTGVINDTTTYPTKTNIELN